MERSKGSIRAFSSVDHVTTTSFSSLPLSLVLSLIPCLLSYFSLLARYIVFFFRCASFLFSILSLSLSSAPSLLSPFFRRHDRVSVPAMLRVQEFRIGKKTEKSPRAWALPPDPNSSTSPRYFRSPAF